MIDEKGCIPPDHYQLRMELAKIAHMMRDHELRLLDLRGTAVGVHQCTHDAEPAIYQKAAAIYRALADSNLELARAAALTHALIEHLAGLDSTAGC